MKTEIDNQLKTLKSGTLEILPAGDLKKKLESGRPLTVKLGVDPTAPDLHLGHAVPLRKLRQFQDFGHRVVLIIGDFTAMIGDPSGRSKTRPHLSAAQVEANAKTYTDQAFKILDRDKTRLEYNSRWLGVLTLEQVLELAGKFTVTALLQRDDFERRYRANEMISLHEFLYPVMQAYDSVVLKADVEIGGSDQKFNLLAGRELQEKMGQEPQVCITLPLLEGTDGRRKMSKSYGNHIGLTFEPWDMFGKVMSMPDDLMIKYFRLATLLDEAAIGGIESGLQSGELHPAEIKRRLAREIVAIYYDVETAKNAEYEFNQRFVKKTEISDVGVGIDVISVLEIPLDRIKDDKIWLPELIKLEGAAKTNSEARRLVSQGGVRLNDVKLDDPNADIEIADGSILEIGKRPRKRIAIK